MKQEFKDYVVENLPVGTWSKDVRKDLTMFTKPYDKSVWFVAKNHITGESKRLEELAEALDYFGEI